MTELEYAIKHDGLTPKQLLKSISQRDFGVTVLGGLAGTAASRFINIPSAEAAANDFTIAIIPDPQYLVAASCPNGVANTKQYVIGPWQKHDPYCYPVKRCCSMEISVINF